MPLFTRASTWLQTHPRGRAALIIAVSMPLGFVLSNVIDRWEWMLWPLAIALLASVVYMVVTSPLHGRCMFCGDKNALMLPMPAATHQPWWRHLHKRDVSWACEEHVEAWMRLMIRVHA